MTCSIGLYGLGVMGASLARNIANNGFSVAVFNRSFDKTEQFLKKYPSDNLQGYSTLKDFVKALTVPRRVVLMVPENAVDEVLDQLVEVLEPGDAVMDGGNSYFKDTARRAEFLAEKKIEFLGCGISGGEKGALIGPSLMPGGSKSAYDMFKDVLEKMAAKDFKGQPCVDYMGKAGAGHYVKMVHNGIEYALMQLLAESYHCLRYGLRLDADQVQSIFEEFNEGRNGGFLVESMENIVAKEDDQGSDEYMLDVIKDVAGQKGTGRWTAIEGLMLGVPLSIIYAAVDARNVSSQAKLREELAKTFVNLHEGADDLDTDIVHQSIAELESCLYQAQILTFVQGFQLLKAADKEYDFGLSMVNIARVWQGGCIVRSKLLQLFEQVLIDAEADAVDLDNLLQAEDMQRALFDGNWSLYELLLDFPDVKLPVFAAARYYLAVLREPKSGAEVIQALRDSFGAHGYERVDKEGKFHSEW